MASWGLVVGGALAIGIAGCGDTSSDPERAPPPYFGTGSRLKPIVHRAGGLELFAGWHDTLLDVQCGYAASARCVPHAEGQVVGWEFLDAGCTLPAARVAKARCNSNVAPRFARGIGTGACDGPPVHRIVGAATPAPVALFSTSQGACAPATPTDSFDYYATELIANEELVSAQHVLRSGERGIEVYALEGDDGSWLVEGGVDPDRDEPCVPPSAPDWTPGDRCLPVPSGPAFVFADSACTTRALNWDVEATCDEPAPRAAVRSTESPDDCSSGTSYEVFELGEAMVSVGYVEIGSACSALGETPVIHYPVAAPLAFDALPALERMTFAGAQLSLPFHGQGGAPLRPVAGFVERASGEACSARSFFDAVLRCVPANWPTLAGTPPPLDGLYGTADCSGAPLVEIGTQSCPASSVPPGILITPPGCTEVIAEVREAVPFTGPIYDVNDKNGNCDSVDRAYLDGIDFYVPGELLAPDDLFAPIVTGVSD